MRKLLFLLICFLGVNFINAQTYNPLSDFKANENPSGVWSFGYGTVGGDFIPCPKMGTRESASIWTTDEGWKGIFLNPKNGKNVVFPAEGLVLKPGVVMMHPGKREDHLSKIRFAAPADGKYQVNVKWTNIDKKAKKVWDWVYTNAASETGKVYGFTPKGFKEVFSKGSAGYSQSTTYSKAMTLKKGEIISFEMGNDGEGYMNASQSIELTVTDITINDGEAYFITSVAGGLCLDNKEGTSAKNGGKVQMWKNVGKTNQKWIFEKTGDNEYMIKSKAGGLYLDNNWETRTEKGGKVQMWQKVGNTNQKWNLEKTGDNEYMIKSVAGGFYLDNKWETRTENGGKVQMWQKFDKANQKWIIKPVN